MPFIIASGEIDLNLAVSLMRAGADDYVQKRDLSRVIPAIERALREAEVRRESKEAKRALEVSESRYRRLFEAAKDGILIIDPATGQILDVNPFMMELLGYSRDEVLGKRLWELGAFKDTEMSKAAFRELQAKGYVRYENLPLESKAGAPRFVEFVSNVYDVGDAKVAQCNIRDITSRKQAEEGVRKLAADFEQRVHALLNHKPN